jgi:molybdenum-dependent DNA-binding transcriptional regulator ModE
MNETAHSPGVRALPLWVAPVPGEALDSWVESLARRHHADLGDMLRAIGITPKLGHVRHAPMSSALVRLTEQQKIDIQVSTAVTATSLSHMTLDKYAGTCMEFEEGSQKITRATLWSRGSGSRFCPECLAQSGGRWQLHWRLGFTFACVRHRRLLSDRCGSGGHIQRARSAPLDLIPPSSQCYASSRPHGGRSPKRCGVDLGDTRALTISDTSSLIINAAATINRAHENSDLPAAYEGRSSKEFFHDLRAVAQRVLGSSNKSAIERALPPALLNQHYSDAPREPAEVRAGFCAPRSAASTAVGLAIAVDILTEPRGRDMGQKVQYYLGDVRPNTKGLEPSNLRRNWSQNASPILESALLSAARTSILPTAQIRYRAFDREPIAPTRGAAKERIRSIPADLWPSTALMIHPRELRTSARIYRAGQAALLLSVGNLDDTQDIAARFELSEPAQRPRNLTAAYSRTGQWPDITRAMSRLADLADSGAIPIDYSRRRRLTYDQILTDMEWQAAASELRLVPGTRMARHLRAYLFTLISGANPRHAPEAFSIRTARQRSEYENLPLKLFPELNHFIFEHATNFLQRNRIRSEPVTWEPAASLFDGLDLPGQRLEDVDITAVHTLVSQGSACGAVAERLGISIDAVRLALFNHPIQREMKPRQPGEYAPVVARIREVLTPERLRSLYVDQRLSFRDIAAMHATNRRIVSILVAEDQLARPRGQTIDPGWLATEYLTNRRTLPDIGREVGMSPTVVAAIAKRSGVTLRGRGGASHADAMAQGEVGPDLLKAALRGPSGEQRVRRFQVISKYRCLNKAASTMGINQSAVFTQLKKLEAGVGGELLSIPTNRQSPHTLTQLGQCLLQQADEHFGAAVGPMDQPEPLRSVLGSFRGTLKLGRFMAIAECGSIDLAARTLGGDRSALVRTLRTLEESCGKPLAFVRSRPEPIELTPVGKLLVKQATDFATLGCER